MTIIKWPTICFGMLQQFYVRAGKYKENPPCKDMRRVGSTFFQISVEQIIYQAFKDKSRDTRTEHVKFLKIHSHSAGLVDFYIALTLSSTGQGTFYLEFLSNHILSAECFSKLSKLFCR